MNQPVFWARGITLWLHGIKVKSVPKLRGKPRPGKELVCIQTSESIPPGESYLDSNGVSSWARLKWHPDVPAQAHGEAIPGSEMLSPNVVAGWKPEHLHNVLRLTPLEIHSPTAHSANISRVPVMPGVRASQTRVHITVSQENL